MTNIRNAINAAMKRRRMNRNQLSVAVADHVSRSQVYDFLSGKSDLGTEKARYLMKATGVRVVHHAAHSPNSEPSTD